MWFITLVKFRRPPTKDSLSKTQAFFQEATQKWGVKIHSTFWTLGRYDAVWITEAPDEKTAMKVALWNPVGENIATETMVAVSRDEAASWVK